MADTASTSQKAESLEQRLDEMLDIESFDPPESFREHAVLSDPAIYEQAEADWKGVAVAAACIAVVAVLIVSRRVTRLVEKMSDPLKLADSSTNSSTATGSAGDGGSQAGGDPRPLRLPRPHRARDEHLHQIHRLKHESHGDLRPARQHASGSAKVFVEQGA